MDFGKILEIGKGFLGNQEAGGGLDLSSLVANAHNNGLGDIVGSWLGNGENMPISSEQVTALLGNEKVAALASVFGVDTSDLTGSLQAILPELIDKASVNGALLDKIPTGDMLAQLAGQFLNRG
jgi:uncharacterized protein YidB (DUF937 family)